VKDSELVRLALVYAVQDREGFAQCAHDEPAKHAAGLAKKFRAYHKKRYGFDHMSQMEADMESAESVSIFEILARK
jgi:hypothetical protein